MPFGPNHEYVTIRLVDFDDLDQNQYVATTQYTFRAGPAERRADLVLLVNGIPAGAGRSQDPRAPGGELGRRRPAGPRGLRAFRPRALHAECLQRGHRGQGAALRGIHAPVEQWGPWRLDEADHPERHGSGDGLRVLQETVASLLRPDVLLDILANFTLFATDKKQRRLKIVCRYQQYEGANKIVERVMAGSPRKGLIWHFQGSGKSLLMVFAAQKLRMQPGCATPPS